MSEFFKLPTQRGYMTLLLVLVLSFASLYMYAYVALPLKLYSLKQVLLRFTGGSEQRFRRTNHTYPTASDSDFAAIERVKPLFYVSDKDLPSRNEQNRNMYMSSDDGQKLIVFNSPFWYTVWHNKSEWKPEGDFVFLETPEFACPRKCAFTDNRTYLDEADAVVFVYTDLHYNIGHPPEYNKKKRNQKWILSTLESPAYYDPARFANVMPFFDWAITFRPHADFYWPYGYFFNLDKPKNAGDLNLPTTNSLKSKRLVASLISNCYTKSSRENLIAAMKKYIDVDEYGGCGNLTCPQENNCREHLGKTHKFILAFENSLCQDYITEKFFEAFTTEAVPVSFGMGDYAEVAPPHSYINALDFPNVKALTEHLKYLDANDQEYLKYFEWRLNYGVVAQKSTIEKFCEICVRLWEPEQVDRKSMPFDVMYAGKRELITDLKDTRKNTLAYRLLDNTTSACITIREVEALNYFV